MLNLPRSTPNYLGLYGNFSRPAVPRSSENQGLGRGRVGSVIYPSDRNSHNPAFRDYRTLLTRARQGDRWSTTTLTRDNPFGNDNSRRRNQACNTSIPRAPRASSRQEIQMYEDADAEPNLRPRPRRSPPINPRPVNPYPSLPPSPPETPYRTPTPSPRNPAAPQATRPMIGDGLSWTHTFALRRAQPQFATQLELQLTLFQCLANADIMIANTQLFDLLVSDYCESSPEAKEVFTLIQRHHTRQRPNEHNTPHEPTENPHIPILHDQNPPQRMDIQTCFLNSSKNEKTTVGTNFQYVHASCTRS